jgi:ribosomal RNA assembly protein
MQELRIPKERIAVLVGKEGTTKRKIEKETKTKLTISSEEGDVVIKGDPLDCFITLDVIKAIGRGFNPKIALQLINEDIKLEVVSILEHAGKAKKRLLSIKSRLIGTRGKARHQIETLTNTDIEVYGKTISIIGQSEDVGIASQAVISLIEGSKHGNVYAYIQKRKDNTQDSKSL